MRYMLALDQSTSATRAIVFDTQGKLIDKESVGHEQHYPRPGWVEHDAEEIYRNTLQALRTLLDRNAGLKDDLLCLSISNQRETVVVFDRGTGSPLHHAIVWQCRRGDPICAELRAAGHEEMVQSKTGLKIDTYFSASKLKWLVDNEPDIRVKLEAGDALIGTMDTYLIYRLTGCRTFATDSTNACRTLLYDIGKLRWDEELCRLFDVPIEALAEVRESSARFGSTDLEGLLGESIPICGVMGDSQAALFAERCFRPGSGKVTLGTGSSVLLNIGDKMGRSEGGMVCTIGWVHGGKVAYAFEGIINCTGATIAWLKDQLRLIKDPRETEELARSVEDNGGVYLVPAFLGLSAPYWNQSARAAIVGLTPASTKSHVARAALESIAYQIRDVVDVMAADSHIPLSMFHADGAMVGNKFLMQFLADIARVKVRASALPELSALGAVLSGMLGMGVYGSLDELARLPQEFVEYTPAMGPAEVEKLYNGWKDAVARVL